MSTSTAQAAALLRRQPTASPTGYADELVELRDGAPSFQPEFVRRPTLIGRLSSSRNAALALIVAPPGYGKTSLLAEWAEHDERPFVWLGPSRGDSSRGLVDSGSSAIGLPDLCRGSRVVVIDDAHLIAPAALREVTESALEDLPEDSMLALASRTEPELPLGRLRAHRALVEIGMNDLAMAAGEACALLRQAGFELELEAVQTLARQTEGWPAALYLAALSLDEHPDAPAGVVGFRGDDHLLSEYLHDEVLAALPRELMSFLLRTSVLDRLTAPLCDAVLRQRGSARALSQLARLTRMLTPVDRSHVTYRWHSLFRESLKGELRRVEPELEPRLHRRASAWYSEHGDLDSAIEHACAAQDAQRTGELLWDGIVRYLTHGRNHLVQRWLSRFADDRIADCARLALCAAHSCLAMGDVERARLWASCAAAAGGRDRDADASQSIAAGVAVIEAAAARGGAVAMRESAQRACELQSHDSPWRSLCRLLKGVAEHLSGDRAAASRLIEEAIDLGGDAAPSVTALCLAQRAMIALEQQDWDLAAELTDRAATVIKRRGLGGEALTALVFAACAAARAHQGRANEAKQDARCATDHLATLGDFTPWYDAEARILLAHASLRLADIVGARTLLAQASRFVRRMPDVVIFEHWFEDAWSQMDTLAETRLEGPSALTIAELRILRFLPSHRSFREIAAQLGVSANTVKTQAHSVYRKLGAASRSEAVARALEAGLLGQ